MFGHVILLLRGWRKLCIERFKGTIVDLDVGRHIITMSVVERRWHPKSLGRIACVGVTDSREKSPLVQLHLLRLILQCHYSPIFIYTVFHL
jgi:hypothetical protein